MDIDKMVPGPQLDFLVATEVFDLLPWEGVPGAVHARGVPTGQTPQPCAPREWSTNPAFVPEVVAAIRAKAYHFYITDAFDEAGSFTRYGVGFWPIGQVTSSAHSTGTMAEAVCKAAIKALRGEKADGHRNRSRRATIA